MNRLRIVVWWTNTVGEYIYFLRIFANIICPISYMPYIIYSLYYICPVLYSMLERCYTKVKKYLMQKKTLSIKSVANLVAARMDPEWKTRWIVFNWILFNTKSMTEQKENVFLTNFSWPTDFAGQQSFGVQ